MQVSQQVDHRRRRATEHAYQGAGFGPRLDDRPIRTLPREVGDKLVGIYAQDLPVAAMFLGVAGDPNQHIPQGFGQVKCDKDSLRLRHGMTPG